MNIQPNRNERFARFREILSDAASLLSSPGDTDKTKQIDDKFAEFGRMSLGIFHDLGNPLTCISLAIEKIESEISKDEHLREHVERAVKAMRRVESFMRATKKQFSFEGRQEVFSVSDETGDAIDLLSHASRAKGVELGFETDRSVILYGNSVKFFRIASNLISNAIDSYEHVRSAEKKVAVTISRRVSCVQLEVRDFGCGIARHRHKAIFEPFFTTKPAGYGMGLGLSTTKAIVEDDFGGTIEVESVEGKGSRFIVRIPLERRRVEERHTPATIIALA